MPQNTEHNKKNNDSIIPQVIITITVGLTCLVLVLACLVWILLGPKNHNTELTPKDSNAQVMAVSTNATNSSSPIRSVANENRQMIGSPPFSGIEGGDARPFSNGPGMPGMGMSMNPTGSNLGTPSRSDSSATGIDPLALAWMNSKGLKIGEKGPNGKTLMHFAAEEGRIDMLELIYARDPNAHRNIIASITYSGKVAEFGVDNGWTPMHFAAFGGSVEAMEWLKDKGLRIDVNSPMCSWSPIHCAAYGGQVNAMQWLKGQGVDVNATNNSWQQEAGKTPMHSAAKGGQVDAMEWLKKQGADVNANRDIAHGGEWYPMHEAAIGGHIVAMNWLKGQGGKLSETLMGNAARHGQIEVMNWLVRQGMTNVDMPSNGAWAPIYHAVTGGQIKAMEWLKEKGADINPINKSVGQNTMHYAAVAGQVKAMEWLKEQGIDINTKTQQSKFEDGSKTPMHLAAQNDQIESMKWLKKQGVDINVKTQSGQTPLGLIRNSGGDATRQATIQWLKDNGAK